MANLNLVYCNCVFSIDDEHSTITITFDKLSSLRMREYNKIKIYNKYIPHFLIPKSEQNDIIIKYSYYNDTYKNCVLIKRNHFLDIDNEKYSQVLTFKYQKRITREHINRISLDEYSKECVSNESLIRTRKIIDKIDKKIANFFNKNNI